MDQYESEDEEITDKKVHLNERFRNARAKLTERLSDSDQVLNKAKMFNDAVKESYKLVTNLTEKTEPKLKGMPSDVKKLESLVKDVEVFSFLCAFTEHVITRWLCVTFQNYHKMSVLPFNLCVRQRVHIDCTREHDC